MSLAGFLEYVKETGNLPEVDDEGFEQFGYVEKADENKYRLTQDGEKCLDDLKKLALVLADGLQIGYDDDFYG